MNLLKNGLVLFILFIYAVACSKQEFAANKNKDASTVSAVEQYQSTLCSSSTLIKPPVDFLFLWDNSGSQYFVTPSTKAALWNTVNLISSRFDYHILMAPLLATNVSELSSSSASFISTSPTGVSADVLNSLATSYDNAVSRLSSMPFMAGSSENGLDRAIALLENNQSNGIFRKNAYTIVVLMSNGDDNSYLKPGDLPSGPEREAFITTKKSRLITIRDTQLKSLMFRFMSMVPHNYCPTVAGNKEANYIYKEVSKSLYETSYTNGMSSPVDQSGRSTADSYDICTTDFNHLFDGINGAIQEVVLKHKYDYWPVVDASSKIIDPSRIRVRKNTGTELLENDANGFTWVGAVTNQNTRYEPTAGEPYTGYVIKLSGTGRVTYPECLIVETEAPVEYYGYIQLSSSPMTGTIQVTINGKTIPESTTDGWQLIGYRASQNIKVISTSNLSEAYPASYKSGYFLKLYGSAVYSNGATVKVIYDPQANH